MAERYEAFGKRLTELLYKNGRTQKELASYLNVSTASTSMWCMGKTFPRPDKQKQIAFFLGISISELLGDNVTKEKSNNNISDTNGVIQKIIEKIVDEEFSKILNKYAELDKEGQKNVDEYIDYLLAKKKR